ncbi:hydrophobin-like protein [Xylaria curta]|nr:hydrophobin-like protein [Xylaria curta]
MQFTLIAIVGVIATAVSAVSTDDVYDLCPDGLYSVPRCCATDSLGVTDFDCHPPSSVPFSANNFKDICAADGRRARCCIIPISRNSQSVLCKTPPGLSDQ